MGDHWLAVVFQVLLIALVIAALVAAMVGSWLWLGVLRDRQRREQWRTVPERWRPGLPRGPRRG